jgi:hypothetical protein
LRRQLAERRGSHQEEQEQKSPKNPHRSSSTGKTVS